MMIFPGYNEQNPVITNKKMFKNEYSLPFSSKKALKIWKKIFSSQKDA